MRTAPFKTLKDCPMIRKSFLSILLLIMVFASAEAQDYAYTFEAFKQNIASQRAGITETPNGKYTTIVEDTNRTFIASLYGQDGELIMDKRIGFEPFIASDELLYMSIVCIQPLNDDGNLVLCKYSTLPEESIDLMNKIALLRLDSALNVVYAKELIPSYSNSNQHFGEQMLLDSTRTHCFISGNVSNDNFEEYTILIKLDIDGNEIFTKAIPQGNFFSPSNYVNYGLCVSNSGPIYTFDICNLCDSMALTKVDANGDLLFRKTYSLFGLPYSINYNNNSDQMLITGLKVVNNEWASLYVKADSLGNIVASKYYSNDFYDSSFRKAAGTADKGFVIFTSKNTAVLDEGDFFKMGLTKIDFQNNIEYTVMYKNDCFANLSKDDLIKTQDGGFAFISDSDGSVGSNNIYICKTNSEMESPCNSSDFPMTSTDFEMVSNTIDAETYEASTITNPLEIILSTFNMPSDIICADSTEVIPESIHNVTIEKPFAVTTLQNTLSISNPQGLDLEVDIFATDGRLLQRQKVRQISLNIPLDQSASFGCYFYTVRSGIYFVSGKICDQ